MSRTYKQVKASNVNSKIISVKIAFSPYNKCKRRPKTSNKGFLNRNSKFTTCNNRVRNNRKKGVMSKDH